MKHKYGHLLRWLLIVMLVATGGCLLFQGCSKQAPTEAPASTVITGTGSITIDQASGWNDYYAFMSSGRNYGKISMLSYDSVHVSFEAYGIRTGSGTMAPDSGYGPSAEVVLGQGYFIKSDNVPHYGRATVTAFVTNKKARIITAQFNWVIQTEAGNRSLQ